MAKIDIARTELVWPGKYNEDGTRKECPRVSLPFQVIESINQSRATREVAKTETPSLFEFYHGKEGDTFEAGWKNKLIWGDNLLVMGSLLAKFSGKIDPFTNTLVKRDEVRPGFWRHMDYSSGVRHPPERIIFGKMFLPPPGKHFKFSQSRIDEMVAEEKVRLNPTRGKPEYWVEETDVKPLNSNWTDIPGYSFTTGYPMENSEALLERVITVGTNENALVADLFCGSGTTLAVAEKLKRRWIGCDVGRFAIHVTRKRLLDVDGCRPFEILNLGKYERQYWQGITFGKEKGEQLFYEYLAFILKLYGAQPVAGLAHLHGRKGRAMVHIGAVDAPVTIDEINSALAECVQLKQSELHIVGWEWEMGLYDLMVGEAKKRNVKLLLLQIPREVMEQQAVDKGDIQFFELAYLEVHIETKPSPRPSPKGRGSAGAAVSVTLKDFVIPNTELVPEEVRSRVKKWSDYIDYWAVDWDFQNDTFMQGWVSYRTRKDRSLALTSDEKVYDKPGRYRVLVKVVHIFGNDTTQAYDVEVK